MVNSHRKVMSHFNIPMNYHHLNRIDHGLWMHHIINTSNSDVVVFFEPDCIPLNFTFLKYIQYSFLHESFVGICQVSNHLPPKSHLYAGPGFYCISTKCFKKLGSPHLTGTARSDTAEELSYLAEKSEIRYRALLPNCYEKPATEGRWALGCVGYFGIGTVYDNSIYHLFQSRKSENIELFIHRCSEVISGTFSSMNFISSTSIDI
jgi:hypothetical protein